MKAEDGDAYDPRALTYPDKGEVKLVHPWSGMAESVGLGSYLDHLIGDCFSGLGVTSFL